MNYYNRHLGDYAKKAGHLSPLEHGVYNLILDAYYDREQPPTRAEAIRWSRARTVEEIAAVDAVLEEFFIEADGRFSQRRVEEEIASYHKRAEANRTNGVSGGRPKKTEEEPTNNPVGLSLEPNRNPIVTLSNSQEPIANKKHIVDKSTANRFSEFWERYPKCPRKTNKPGCLKTWKSKNLDSIADKILTDLAAREGNKQWEDFTPMPSTYLNQERWNDEPLENPFGRVL